MTDVASLLLDTAASGELHHAIILHGPSRSELMALATHIARRLICPNHSGEDNCSQCSRVERGLHPDLQVIGVESDRKWISIEQVRNLVNDASLRPYEGRTKVIIIEAAEAMTTGAANALLKTLEEPVADTVFLLLARSADQLLPTIRSRSQSVYVGGSGGLTAAQIVAGRNVSLQEARLIRDAAMYGEESEAPALARSVTELLARYAATGEVPALLALAASLSEQEEPSNAIALLVAVLRDLAALDPADTIDPAATGTIRAALPPERLLRAADRGTRAVRRLAVNADVRMIFEHILLELAR